MLNRVKENDESKDPPGEYVTVINDHCSTIKYQMDTNMKNQIISGIIKIWYRN